MNRAILSPLIAKQYFDTLIAASDNSLLLLSQRLSISRRTLLDWRKGKYTIPIAIFEQMRRELNIQVPLNFNSVDSRELKSIAGRKGAMSRMKKWGNPGTPVGRRKGGLNSLKTHTHLNTGFKVLKIYPNFRFSQKLAEFIGIMLGDGGMSNYQARITLNYRDDNEYAQFIVNLSKQLFDIHPSILKQKNRGTIELVFSGKHFVKRLKDKGLVIGNKIKQQIRFPEWIYLKQEYVKVALRGLFDTDGSVFLDKHNFGKKHYKSICIAFTTYSNNLRSDIYKSLVNLGYNPTISTSNRVMLRRKNEVDRFFSEISPSNEKHRDRFKRFTEE